MNLEIEIGMLKAKVHYLEQMLEATIRKIDDNQPERSKREDFYQKLSKEYLDKKEYWEINVSEKISIECFAEWLDKRCGALNPMET